MAAARGTARQGARRSILQRLRPASRGGYRCVTLTGLERPDSGDLCPLRLVELLAGTSEAAFAAAVGLDRGIEGRRVEIGPQRVGEVELAVGELPEQEVADPLLAAGADEQIGLGRVAHGEVGGEIVLADFVFRTVRFRQPPEGLENIPAPPVVGGDGERELAISGGQILAL